MPPPPPPKTLEQQMQTVVIRIAERENTIQQLIIDQEVDKATLNYMLTLM